MGYYENSGEFIGHYLSWLKEWAAERRASYGGHFIPHAGDRESLWLEGCTKGVMNGLGFHPTVVERQRSKGEASAAARTTFARCQFDEGACELALRRPLPTPAVLLAGFAALNAASAVLALLAD